MGDSNRPTAVMSILLMLFMAAVGVVFARYVILHRPAPKSTSVATKPAPVAVTPTVTAIDPQVAIDTAKDSTVLILHKADGGVVSGSGFCVGNSGVIVTNRHVVTDDSMQNPVDCIVCFFCGSGHEKAVTVPAADIKLADDSDGDGNDANLDLAALKVDPDIVKPLAFGDSDRLFTTQKLYAVGFPHGTTVLTPAAEDLPDPSVLEEVVQRLQKDSQRSVSVMQLGGAMTHGDSGGPVIDEKGNVVGMCESVEQDASIGYAIPSLFVKRLIAHAGFPPGKAATPSMTGPVTLDSLQAQLDAGPPPVSSDDSEDETHWQTYADAAGGYALEYPAGWKVDPPTSVAPGVARVRIESGPFTSILVDVSQSSSGSDAKDAWQKASDGLAKKWGSKYQLAGIDSFSLGGEAGAIWMFTLERSGEPRLTKTDIGVTHSGHGYALLCTAPSDDFKNHIDQFNHIVNSFAFANAPSPQPPGGQ